MLHSFLSVLHSFYPSSLRNSDAKYIGNKMLGQKKKYVGKITAKESAESFLCYVGNSFGIPQHFAKGYDLVFY